MANATAAIQQDFKNEDLAITTTLTMAASITAYEGTLVSIDGSGTGIVGVTTARIAGVAKETATGGNVATCYNNVVLRLVKADASATDVNKTAYAADNQTATLSSNTAILGTITGWETGYVFVHLTLRA